MYEEYDASPNIIKRALGGIGGFALLILGIVFSTNLLGDRFVSQAVLGIATGLTIGVVITVLEFIFNSEGGNMTLTVKLICASAYLVGITSNVLGLVALQNGDWLSWVIGVGFGLPIEILPEPLLYWAFTGNWPEQDLLGSIFGTVSSYARPMMRSPQPQFRPQGSQPPLVRYEGDRQPQPQQQGGGGNNKPK